MGCRQNADFRSGVDKKLEFRRLVVNVKKATPGCACTKRVGRRYSLAWAFPCDEEERWLFCQEHGGVHFLAFSPNCQWYQHSAPACALGWWSPCELRSRLWLRLRLRRLPEYLFGRPRSWWSSLVSDWTCKVNCWTCSASFLTLSSSGCDGGETMEAVILEVEKQGLDGELTSMILSANSANCWTVIVSLLDARTVWTWCGRRCKNSCLKMLISNCFPPSNCSMRRRSWVGVRSPSSSAVRSWCSLFCSDAVVRFINSAFKTWYGLIVGGVTSNSRTAEAYSGWRDDTT